MNVKVSAVEVRQNLGKFLNIVALRHDDVIIERAGKPIARMTAYDTGSPTPPAGGRVDFCRIRGLGKEVWRTVDAGRYVEEERRQWN